MKIKTQKRLKWSKKYYQKDIILSTPKDLGVKIARELIDKKAAIEVIEDDKKEELE